MTQIKSIYEIKEGDEIVFMGWGIPIKIQVTNELLMKVAFAIDLQNGHFWK